jgi:hypothetical protein
MDVIVGDNTQNLLRIARRRLETMSASPGLLKPAVLASATTAVGKILVLHARHRRHCRRRGRHRWRRLLRFL